MPETHEALTWIGNRVDDVYGARVGKIEDAYVDAESGAVVWLLVRLGRFGDRHTLMPTEDAVAGAGHVWVPFERRQVQSAPAVPPGEPLTCFEDLALAAHYGLEDARRSEIRDDEITAFPAGAAREHSFSAR
ncbi:MAG TPA: PRC-barrel domain-containing protein [Thermoleophilaceae bacterium]|nr:PRC-barrel domain-containing protein [Thermoleophilaceae bacterium]